MSDPPGRNANSCRAVASESVRWPVPGAEAQKQEAGQ